MTTFDAPAPRGWRLHFDRWTVVAIVACLLAAALAGGLAYRAFQEHGGVNSYALLADAYLHGRFDSPKCFDEDCARFMERIYVIFPPVPALVATPLVALFGPDAKGFLPIAAALTALTALAWWMITGRLGLARGARFWATLAFIFGTPAIYVALRGDGVWYFAQGVALVLVSFAILAALDRRLLLAGVLIGLAFLSRQMAIFLMPFLFALSRPKGVSLFALDRDAVADGLKLGLPIVVAIGAYCAYNFARFGAPFETGYAYIANFPAEDTRGFITWRILDYGLFSAKYLVFNLAHMFLQGFHMEFSGKYMTEVVRMDPMGSSILAASPFVLFAFFARPSARLFVGLAVIALVLGITLFYHSNGYSQQNVQRYALDWLPVLYVLLLPAFAADADASGDRLKMFKLLVTYAIGLNAVAFGVVAITKGAV
ncbi:MAG: hypothetical protein ABW275_04890 [Hansschlegelia sp.]